MGFTIRRKTQPLKMVRTKTGKTRESLLQPPQLAVEHHDGPTDVVSALAPVIAAGGPRVWLQRIIDESRQILRDAGIPDRPVVLTSGAIYRKLNAKERACRHRLPWEEVIDGERRIRISHPKWREPTEKELARRTWELPLVSPGVFAQTDSAEDYSAMAIKFAEDAIAWIDRGQSGDALYLAMRAQDFYWKAFLSQVEPALLAGVDVCKSSKRVTDPRKVGAKFEELRRDHPRWGATAIRKQAADELKSEGRGYSYETLKKFPVPGLAPRRRKGRTS